MEDRMEECIQPGVGKGKDVSAVRETIENVIKQVPREPVCMTRSDSMSIGSVGSASDVASVGGASEEMDTEDSEKDARESFMSSTSSFSSVDGQRKRSADSLSLVLDNQRSLKPGVNEMGSGEGPTTGDVTSPVFENKLSDNVEGYFMMRTRLLSKSAVILENGGAFGEEKHPVLCDSDEANHNVISGKCENEHVGGRNSAERISDNGGPTLASECEGSENGRHDAIKNEPAETQNTLSCEGHFQTIISDLAGAEHGGRGRDDERHSPRGVSNGVRSNDISIKSEPASEGEEEHEEDETSVLLTRTVVGDALDSSCSDSMAEVEKFGLEAKLARVSKRRVYSKASEMAYKDSNSSSESDSDSDSEEEEEEEKDSMLEDLHAAKVLVNAAQPDSEKMIKREVLKMVCPDDLLSDYVSSEDSSASSSDSSSGESSDSEDSSDSDLSSVDESDDEEEEEEVKTSKPRQNQTAPRDGLYNQDLPKVEYVQINLPDSVQLTPLGTVSSIIGSLVIIQAEPGTPAINTDSVLFKADKTVLGQVYEIFGPVASPFYSVRFNCPADIEEHGIHLQTRALFAPQNIDVTQYVFTEQLKKCRGSDASWKNDEEPPDEFREFSDDEEEALAKNKKKKDRKRKVPQGKILNGQENWTQNGPSGWNQGPRRGHFQSNVQRDQPRAHPPLQRTTPVRPLLPFPAGSGPRPPRGFGARPPASFHGPPRPSTRGHQAFGHMGVRGPPPETDWGQRFPAPWNLPPPPPPPPSSRDSHSGQFQGNPFLLGQQPSCPPTLSGEVLRSPMFQNPFVNAPPPLMSPPVSCPPPFQATVPGAAPPPAASPLATPPLQQHQQHLQQGPHQVRGFSARKTDSALSRQKRQTGEGAQAVYSARKSGIAPPWQKKQPVQPAMTTSVASAVPANHPPPLMGQPSSLGASTIPVGGNSAPVQSLSSRMSLFPPTNLPPPPVPPPAFHPRMMQSFRRPPNARGGFNGAS